MKAQQPGRLPERRTLSIQGAKRIDLVTALPSCSRSNLAPVDPPPSSRTPPAFNVAPTTSPKQLAAGGAPAGERLNEAACRRDSIV